MAMGVRLRAALAGVAGAIVAFGVAELVHGLYSSVPSVFVALVQGIIEFTPGELVTRGIETLGQADIPVLVSCTVVGALILAAALANLALRRPPLVLLAVGVLGAIGSAASLAMPFVDPLPAVLTIAGALALGVAVTEALLRASGLRPERPAPPPAGSSADPSSPVVRSREAHSPGGAAVGRRGFLLLGALAATAGLVAAGAGRLLAGGQDRAAAPKRLDLPESPSGPSRGDEKGGAALSVRHETLPPVPKDASIGAPGMVPLVTPAESFYLIDTAFASPRIDVSSWKLSIKGAVKEPVEFSYKDLLGMPTREADITLSCVSNEVGGGLVSNGRWTGVLLSDVLAEAGVSRDAIDGASEQLVGRSVDGWTSGFRTELALDGREALVAFGLNGSELPLKHGYPVRLVVPGLYGYVSATKWLTEIELTSWDFDAYWIQRSWSKEGPVKTQSRIDTVKSGERLRAGEVPIGGVAWAPHRGIERVEVSTDGGGSWAEARLASQLDPDSWRQYLYEWDARSASGTHTLKVRATDGEGETQTAEASPPHPSGATGYHTVRVTVT